jgi:hypothetical protein
MIRIINVNIVKKDKILIRLPPLTYIPDEKSEIGVTPGREMTALMTSGSPICTFSCNSAVD